MKAKIGWMVLLSLMFARVAMAAPLNPTQMRAMKAVYAQQDKALLAKNLDAFMARRCQLSA